MLHLCFRRDLCFRTRIGTFCINICISFNLIITHVVSGSWIVDFCCPICSFWMDLQRISRLHCAWFSVLKNDGNIPSLSILYKIRSHHAVRHFMLKSCVKISETCILICGQHLDLKFIGFVSLLKILHIKSSIYTVLKLSLWVDSS